MKKFFERWESDFNTKNETNFFINSYIHMLADLKQSIFQQKSTIESYKKNLKPRFWKILGVL